MGPGRYVAVAACVAAMAVVAGCGRGESRKGQTAETGNDAGSPAEASGTVIDPCKLLTKADAGKILNAAVTDGKHTQDVGFAPGRGCSYLTSAPIEEAGGTWGVSLEVYDQATFDQKGSYFKSPALYFNRNHKAMKSAAHADLKDVKGVGKAAYWSGGQLYVLDRGTALVFTVRADFHIPPGPGEKVDVEEDAAALKASTDLAKTVVLPRLEKL